MLNRKGDILAQFRISGHKTNKFAICKLIIGRIVRSGKLIIWGFYQDVGYKKLHKLLKARTFVHLETREKKVNHIAMDIRKIGCEEWTVLRKGLMLC